MPESLENLQKDLKKLANKDKAKILQRFFKTEEGEYGHGDIFLGITVPDQRAVAKKYLDLSLEDIEALLNSEIHEHRLTGLIILVHRFEKAKDEKIKKIIFDFYLAHTARVNNWDLVDTSAGYIVGTYLIDKDKKVLTKLAKSRNLWERRISIIATQHFIKHGHFDDTLTIAELLMNDAEDLIHKAVGWMLREVGNKSLPTELQFLNKWHKIMPRTMLRYAIEKFPEDLRQAYLAGTPSSKLEHE